MNKKTFAFRFLGFLLSLPVVAHFIFWGLVWAKTPKYTGEMRLLNFSGSATVYRDSIGIPHIEADSSRSAYFALGYTIAQDRLFQIELQRRVGKGELSELFGEALLDSDRFLRTLLLRKTAEEYIQKQAEISPEAWIELDAFLEGINAFIAEGNFPIEFTLLGHTPKPLERVDAVAFLYYMGFSFAEGLKSDSLFSILEQNISGRVVRELFPRYDFEPNASILEHQPGFPKVAQTSLPPQENPVGLSWDSLAFVKAIDQLDFLQPPFWGSNSWLLSPKRSASGGALLANDPHIGLSNPGIWYEAHLKFPGYENYGYFLAIFPFPLVAHNQDKAWGLTMLEQDDVNLYAETLKEEKVLFQNVFVPLLTKMESIPVRGKDPVPFEIRITPHGPLVTDFIKEYQGQPLSLYWVNHHLPNPIVEVLHKLGRASSLAEMQSLVGKIAAPGLNISYADKAGNIAYFAVGRFPILEGNPRKVLDGGNGGNEVKGFLPTELNPRIINPPSGIIATANNLVTEKSLPGLGNPEGNWQPPDRFLRIKSLLAQKEKWSLEEMSAMQFDSYASFAPEYLAILLPILGEGKTDRERAAIQILKQWDFSHSGSSAGALVYEVFFRESAKALFEDELGEKAFLLYGDFADSWMALRYMVRHPDSLFWDNAKTIGIRESREETLKQAFLNTIHFLEDNVSQSPSLWTWDRLYRVKHPHPLGKIPLLGKVFDQGPFPSPGGAEVINNLKYKVYQNDFTASAGPSHRRVVDYGRFLDSKTQIPLGNSGNLGSPYYQNLAQEYKDGKARTMLWDPKDYQTKASVLHFLPRTGTR